MLTNLDRIDRGRLRVRSGPRRWMRTPLCPLSGQFDVRTPDRGERGTFPSVDGRNPAFRTPRDRESTIEAAAHLSCIRRLALYELPFVTDDSRKPVPPDFAEHLADLLARDRRGAALRYFFTAGVALPPAMVALMRLMPAWPKLKALAPSLPYDAEVIRGTGSGGPLPADRWSSAGVPTLVIAGGKSPAWMHNSMQRLAGVLPNATHRTLERQTHIVKPKALAPVLSEFFSA